MTVVNALVSFGLLLLYLPSYRIWASFSISENHHFCIFLSNLFLVVVPFFPTASRTYEKLPYWVCYYYHLIFFLGYVVVMHFTFLSRTPSAASSSHPLVSHTGIYGVLGFQKGENIDFSESGLMKMIFLDTYSAEYLQPRSVVSTERPL
jgi:hypothetical protein